MTSSPPLRDRVREAYTAYNQAYNRRGDPAAAAALRQARLDLLLALTLVEEDLSGALLRQLGEDAVAVLDLDVSPG